eukprot:303918_1
MKVHIHHKGCYGIIKLFSKEKDLSPVNGITLSTYFDHHETATKRSIIRSDRIMLHKLTAQTLFCPHCYQPFLIYDGIVKNELVSPFAPLFDYISAIIFLAVPIAWIPLLIILFIGTMLQHLNNWFTERE